MLGRGKARERPSDVVKLFTLSSQELSANCSGLSTHINIPFFHFSIFLFPLCVGLQLFWPSDVAVVAVAPPVVLPL